MRIIQHDTTAPRYLTPAKSQSSEMFVRKKKRIMRHEMNRLRAKFGTRTIGINYV